MKKRNKLKKALFICISFFLCWIVFDLLILSQWLQITVYKVTAEKIVNNIRVVLISDLHSKEFGESDIRLIDTILKQKPDIICIAGDLIDKSADDIDSELSLLRALTKEAPVYVSLGNHECQFTSGLEIVSLYEDTGACVFEQTYKDIQINGNEIRIGGFFGYGSQSVGEKLEISEIAFLHEFEDDERYTILLAHMPHCWYIGGLDYWNTDLVLCGHTHGGQIRIPVIGALYAPDMGFFPGRECGIYDSEDHSKHMVLTRGLGSTQHIPRLNNRPEITVVDIEPAKTLN